MVKNAFYFMLKAPFVHKVFKFCFHFLVMQKKRFDQKDKVIFKIFDIITWLTNNNNTHIAQYSRSKDNQTMKFGQFITRERFFLKNNAEKRQEDQVRTCFCFLKKLYLMQNQMVCSLVSIYFDSPQLDELHISLDQWSKVLYSLYKTLDY